LGKRGPQPGSGGRPKKPLAEKIADGNPGKRALTVIDFENTADIEGQPMPKPSEFLSAEQKDGKPLGADVVYRATWEWLNERGCASLVSPQLIEKYAVCTARWQQCEEATTSLGMIAKHPTTNAPIQSPYVAIGNNYLSQANRLWSEIFQIVRENCTKEYSGDPHEDIMEQLLNSRRG
jgi:hypothetical protein